MHANRYFTWAQIINIMSTLIYECGFVKCTHYLSAQTPSHMHVVSNALPCARSTRINAGQNKTASQNLRHPLSFLRESLHTPKETIMDSVVQKTLDSSFE